MIHEGLFQAVSKEFLTFIHFPNKCSIVPISILQKTTVLVLFNFLLCSTVFVVYTLLRKSKWWCDINRPFKNSRHMDKMNAELTGVIV